MRKVIIYVLLFYVNLPLLVAQIGINTDNPQALFHIDGASTPATTNPQSGSITELQASDDVVITNEGNLGIGTIAPSAKLHISGGSIKIADGTQGNKKVLISDNNGYGSWSNIAGTWFAALVNGNIAQITDANIILKQVVGFDEHSSVISSSTEGAINAAKGTITVPYSGFYKIVLSAYFANDFTDVSPGQLYIAFPDVQKNNSQLWDPHIIGIARTFGAYPSFVTFVFLEANDELKLFNHMGSPFTDRMSNAMLIVEFLQPRL